ncbi:MAG TPA: PAS domain-containing protein [Bryobacteraceae bacterium]|nr:PAS domain-containing protein [Bryobacteraceae bacterium]
MLFQRANRRTWLQYAVAVLAVALAAGVRFWPLGFFGTQLPYVTFYPAVILAALYGGFSAGLLATLLSALAVAFFWIAPVNQLAIRDPADAWGLALFILSCVTVSWISERMHRAQARVGEAEAEAKLASERERAAEEIRRVTERLQLAAEAAEIGICSWTTGTPDLVVDATWKRLLGRSPDTRVTLEDWQAALHPDDRERVVQEWNAALEQHVDFNTEYRVACPDGTVRWLADRGRASHDEKSGLVRFAGVTVNVTARKRAEEGRAQEAERLRRFNRALRAIGRSNQALLVATNEAALLEETCQIVVEECGYAMVWVGFREEDEARTVRPAAFFGLDEGYLASLNVTWADTDRGRGPTGTAVRTGQVRLCRDMLTDPLFVPWRAETTRRGYASSAALPLLDGGQAFGALTIYAREPDGFPDDEIKLLAELAGDLAYGITVLRLRAAHAQAEQALRESEERLRLAYDGAHAGAWEWDLRTNENVWSEELWKVYGIEPHSVKPSYEAWRQVIHPDDRQRAERAVQEAARNGTALEVEFRVRDRDGTERWLLARGRPLRDAAGQAVRFTGIVVDITDRRRAEEDVLQASEQRRLALEAGGLGAWNYHFTTGDVVWDDRCRNLFGIPSGTRIEYNSAIDRIHPDDRAATTQAVDRAIAGADDGAYHREFRVVWPDGSVHWVSSHGRVYFEGEGENRKAARFVGVNLDITARKRAEENIRQSQKLESIGLLAGGIAHDFNNLLVGVIGNASLAEDMLPQGSPLAGILKGIVRSGEQAAHLTRQMLAYAGKGQFVLEEVDLTAMVRETTVLLQSSVSKKIAWHFDLSSAIPAVEADPSQMQQVFMNLALNAAEAIGDQAGVVSVATGEQEVFAAEARDELQDWPIEPGRHVFLEVRDTGCGMSAEALTRIYDPFFTTKFQGRGLGLAAVAGIVRSHKGAIRLVTAAGGGSSFRVLFPAILTPAVKPARPQRRKEDVAGQGAILIVDDEEIVRDLGRRSLERQGHPVLVVADGPAAIEALRSQGSRVQLVILDSGLIGMSGAETLVHLRELRPGLEVLISSGYSEDEALRPFAGAPISGFIQKPYLAQDLTRAVKSALAKRQTSS